MGFRTVVVSEDIYLALPQWFTTKHTDLHFGALLDGTTSSFPLASHCERKFYKSKKDALFVDLRRVLVEAEYQHTVELVLLHECGGVTKVSVHRDGIRMFEPTAWREVEQISHSYCYGCSEPADSPAAESAPGDNAIGG
ncbi:hypothetical protein [Nocardia sp. BMG51109]|uniref:hypothetical protein n=1 Tax=Nocardia sp. BMG51109 TaxID=1056816 RepID=UPI00046540D1|nr:hypothetical protein [Nocardia sp. BMG51109]